MEFLKVSQIALQESRGFALQSISFSLQEFQRLAIAGETGSGKSTLLKVIGGLVQPGSGEVWLEQKRVKGPEEKLMPGHPQIAYLSQHFELRNNYTVQEELEYTNQVGAEAAWEIFKVCRIDHLLKRRTGQLSGGERQRIALCRILIAAPRLLLLDEPFSNLDITHKNILKQVIRAISEQLKITCILVSHDPADVLSWAEEVIVMKDGNLVQKGAPQQVYRQPVNEYVAGLFGRYNLVEAENAAALLSLPPAGLQGKKMIVRPEQFTITGNKEKRALAGRISNIHFLGPYYEIEVISAGMAVTITTKENSFVKGDAVYFSLVSEEVWFI